MAFTTKAVQAALRDAVTGIEAGSSIEVVVAVRPRLRRWPSANAAIGVVCAMAALAFTLFADAEFELWEILLIPWLAGMVGGIVVELLPGLGRALTPPRIRTRDLREASRATFVELGVHKTSGRTGLLVYLSLRDRLCALVGDVAVVDKLGQATLDRIAAKLAAEIPAGGESVARALRGYDKDFAKALPRGADDINQLPDEPHMQRPRARLRAGKQAS